MSESISLVKKYLKEFANRLTKIEEAQKKGSQREDEEWRNEEERVKVSLKRTKSLSLSLRISKKKWSWCRRYCKKHKGSMTTLFLWEVLSMNLLCNFHPNLPYQKIIGSQALVIPSNIWDNIWILSRWRASMNNNSSKHCHCHYLGLHRIGITHWIWDKLRIGES